VPGRRRVAHFDVRLSAIDKPTNRLRWNGEPMASDEASKALSAGVDAFQEALRRHGFEILRTGYGVTATEHDDGS
jgi:hypothetical protein